MKLRRRLESATDRRRCLLPVEGQILIQPAHLTPHTPQFISSPPSGDRTVSRVRTARHRVHGQRAPPTGPDTRLHEVQRVRVCACFNKTSEMPFI